MKRRIILPLLLTAALAAGALAVGALAVGALAAGGDAYDPLISLDYLNSIFAPRVEQAAQEKLDGALDGVYDAAELSWRAAVAEAAAAAGTERAATWTEARLKHGDMISGVTGMQFMLLAGEASVQFASGTVVDVTDASELPSGGELRANHRYLVAEDTTALFTVISRTAVVRYCGDYRIAPSNGTPDYNAMASALKTLSLFLGTDLGCGEGFELERTPTRVEALVMLIRLLGEKEAALACEASVPFTDVPEHYWGRPYIAYAYERGYTNGVSATEFAPNLTASANMYVEFVLRALGYSDTTQTDITDAPQRAQTAGVLTAGEAAVLGATAFLRADVVYLSWYALGVPVAQNMRPLHEKLEAAGVFTEEAYRSARALVSSARL